jgi:hypothetical protein
MPACRDRLAEGEGFEPLEAWQPLRFLSLGTWRSHRSAEGRLVFDL